MKKFGEIFVFQATAGGNEREPYCAAQLRASAQAGGEVVLPGS